MQRQEGGGYDVAIIGGGHNGLTAAAYLAGAGLSVVVLEKNAVTGGAAITEEFHPGFCNSVASYTVSLLDPRVIRDLELDRFGLRIVERPVANFWPIDARRSLTLGYATPDRQKAIAEHSPRDAERLPGYEAAIARAAGVLRHLVDRTPPNIGGGAATLLESLRVASRLAGLSVADKRLVADLFTRSVADFLDGWFECDIVKAAFAFDGIVGTYAAPSTPGTAYTLLHHCFGEVNGKVGVWGHAIGGMGAITSAMRRAAEARGAVVRTTADVKRVIVEDGRARGLELATGEQVRARAIASNVAPTTLVTRLLPEAAVPADLRARFGAMRVGSGTFRMNIALSELPGFTCRPGTAQQAHHGAGIIIGPTLDYLEKAYLDARVDGWSRQPVVEMLIPSTLDSTLAPPRHHVASLFVQHVAPRLPTGRDWADDREKEAFADVVVATVSGHAPNFAASIIARQVLSPLDLEHRFGLPAGDIFHGQLSLDQLYATRPVAGFAAYRMPVAGLYLCGSGAHPGGGVTGLPGRNAAREIVRDLRSRRMRH